MSMTTIPIPGVAPGSNNDQASAELGRPVGIGMPMENQMAQNPIYGTDSPFQPPAPGQMDAGFNTNMGIFGNGMGFGKGIGGMIPQQAYGMYGNGQPFFGSNPLQGAPANGLTTMSPSVGTPTPTMPAPPTQRPIGIGMPMEPGQQQFTGGLRPAPRGYRPPMRNVKTMRRGMMR